MKKIILLSILLLACSKEKAKAALNIQQVEASCGQCQFALKGSGCDLAVRINGKAYFVSGTNIDDHGDAHAPDGFCEAIRKADVIGDTLNGKFHVTYFKLISEAAKDSTHKI